MGSVAATRAARRGPDHDVTPTVAGRTVARQARGRIAGLDGLRALAVLAVVVYHVQPTWLPGGFLGVDVFFVVSGFLITTLLLRELQRSRRLSLPSFWLRRARRLLPALGVVVVTSILAARLVEPDLLVGIGRQTLGALTFSSNWVQIASGASYFDRTAPDLFMTFWSLAIEEQFYVLWPLLLALLVALTTSGRTRARVALAGAVASALLMALLYTPGTDPTRVYYGTDTHVFGLLLGVAAAFWWTTRPRLLAAAWAHRWVPVASLAGLLALMLTLHDDADLAYRGGIALGSVLALGVVAGCTGGATTTVRALELRPARWVGERSYGIYLWHWPLLLLAWAAVPAEPGTARWWWSSLAAVALTFAASWASYRWVETPIRRDGFRLTAARAAAVVRQPGARVAPAVAVVGVLALVGTGVVVATAPAESAAQRSIEQGLSAIDTTGTTGGAGALDAASPFTVPGATARGPAIAARPDPRPSRPGAGGGATSSGLPPLLVKGKVDGRQVIGFGDSVLSGAAPAVLDHFPGIALDAKPIRKWVDAPALVQKAADAGKLRPYVVLNFGTNGGFQFKGSDTALEKVLSILGPGRRIVLVNTVGVSYWVPDANKQLARIAAKHPNVVVADWNHAVRGKPGLLHADRTHPNMQGIDVYAGVVDAALREAAGR
ncbi:acyltransferase family protein [Luteimicrobium sp. DT211]|uniref:acyltransferase family protein n=1 Tax=Luteimicrobium sp. DT211 TaxID=3393412 RepID=UPI003CFAC86F